MERGVSEQLSKFLEGEVIDEVRYDGLKHLGLTFVSGITMEISLQRGGLKLKIVKGGNECE